MWSYMAIQNPTTPAQYVVILLDLARQRGVGASDLLAVQIREQAAFDAEVLEVNSAMEFFRAQADLAAATASSAPRP